LVAEAEENGTNSVVPDAEINHLNQAVLALRRTTDRDLTERTLQAIDKTLQKCWQQLGLVDEIFDDVGLIGAIPIGLSTHHSGGF